MFLILRNAKIVYAASKSSLSFQSSRCLVVNQKTGKIVANLDEGDLSQDLLSTFQPCITHQLLPSQIIIPGFVDTHVHAPQFSFVGTGLDLPLLEWLNKYTFPSEAKFSDLEFAKKVYQKSANSHTRNGTTTICYFGTLHLEATKLLAHIIDCIGIRGFVGKVCMDTNSPIFYCESSSETSLQETRKFIEHLKVSNSSVVPVITPRFAPTCTSQLMTGLGKIAKEQDLPIQTHLSENRAEIEWVQALFPDYSSYAEVYQKHGILGPKTVLAHCVHITDQELSIIQSEGSGISHCPNSNTSLLSGAMSTRKLIDSGVKLGLGTDVAGGYSCSIFNAIRDCIGVSKLKYSALASKDS